MPATLMLWGQTRDTECVLLSLIPVVPVLSSLPWGECGGVAVKTNSQLEGSTAVVGRSWDGCRTLWARALLSALSILIYYLFYWTSSFSINMPQTPAVTEKHLFKNPRASKVISFQTPADSIDFIKRNSWWPCQFQNWTAELGNELRRRNMYCWGRNWGLPPYSALQPASCFRRTW